MLASIILSDTDESITRPASRASSAKSRKPCDPSRNSGHTRSMSPPAKTVALAKNACLSVAFAAASAIKSNCPSGLADARSCHANPKLEISSR